MAQFQFQLATVKPHHSFSFMPIAPLSISHKPFNFLPKSSTIKCLSNSPKLNLPIKLRPLRHPSLTLRSRLLELDKPEERRKPKKSVNGVFWIILLNLGLYVADHVFQVRSIKSLYLYHNFPAWYQFVTAAFCHANWNHLSSNLFFLYIFGKLVEEEEGNFGLWLSYIFTAAAANFVSWLILPKNAVSVGASGAVFGLFAISVLVKVMEAAQASAGMSGTFIGGYSVQSINHIAHLSGALFGVFLVWLLSRVPSQPPENKALNLREKGDKSL
ncbi:Rhomboid-like protein 11 [Citrus sinensis]|uniref:Rhomboid-like protein 11 n=1 Tax=Citrus sinensis TaxID=2711 RepID=A0ACB8NP81_CITSI|nr:Rhomboid-like protein 11 [Citrus sinensis]